ncbi:MAG: ABC transporter substrate-binding protein [Acidimicrobiales bacterium]
MIICTRLAVLVAAGALVVGCTAGDETGSTTTTAAPSSAAAATGPAPGVTDDAIKVGVTFVDLEALGDIATLDHGDYEAAYQALFDDINANGGINGRMVEATIVGVNPVGTDSADAACVQLTEDEDVFATMGFFNGDAPNCVVGTHQTALIGGSMTPERLAQAQAPWFSADAGTDLQSEVVRAMADAGEFDDATLGVYSSQVEEGQVNDEILPLLDELGVEVTETIISEVTDAGDITQTNAAVQTAAERFTASGVDTLLVVGDSGLGWANGVEPTDYRPRLLLTAPNSVQAWASDPAGHDLSVLDEAAAGNVYGPNQNVWELPQMQECIQIVEDAGVPVPEPDSVPEDEGAVYLAGMDACRSVRLFQALVEAAGEDLNYGTLTAAADGLEVALPDQPEPLTYGPPPHADGDLPAYVYDWDPDLVDWTLRD